MVRPPEEVYTHSHHPVVLAAHARRTAEEAASFLLPHLEPGMSLLDLGCGPGSITVGLARYVAPGRVVGVDAAPAALEHARALAAAEGLDHVDFVQSDVYGLPFPDASFDVVYAHQLMQHLADPVQALRESRRVLKPGGYIAVRDADYGTMTWYPASTHLDRWLAVYRSLARANGGEPDAGRRVVHWVRSAGFEHLHATSTTWTFATPDDRHWWADLWAGRLEEADLMARAIEAEATTASEIEVIAQAFRDWAAHPDGWFAFIQGACLGRRPSTD